jgi:hypothetical protein
MSKTSSTIKYLGPVRQRAKLDKALPPYSKLAFDYLCVEAQNRLRETFDATAGPSETGREEQEIIVPHEGSSGRFKRIEESFFWLTSAAMVAGILFYVLAL